MSQTQNSRPGFKSKLPRPVSATQQRRLKQSDLPRHPVQEAMSTNKNHFKIPFISGLDSKPRVSRLEVFDKPGAAVMETKSTSSGSVNIDGQNRSVGLAGRETQIEAEPVCEEDDFEADPKALESILSNKGITAELFSHRPSAVQHSLSRPSIYYQSPSRMSMMDSHTLFKEKMKLLKEQMKSLNVNIGATPKSETGKMASTTSSHSSTGSTGLYYKMKPFQKKSGTPDHTTPVGSRLKNHSSLSERKQLQPKDTNSLRLCHTASKLNVKPHSSPCSSTSGKENKSRVKFKLFSSPIHELSENTSPLGNVIQPSSSHATVTSSLQCHSQPDNQYKASTDESSQSFIMANKDVLLKVTSAALKNSDAALGSTSCANSSLSSDKTISSCSYTNVLECPPVMSASTVSTWTVKNSMCTPKSNAFTPVKTAAVIPILRIINNNNNDNELKDSGFKLQESNTPSRIFCSKNGNSLHKPPQRIQRVQKL